MFVKIALTGLHEHQEIASAKTCSVLWFTELGRVMLATRFIGSRWSGAVAKM
jgi:hypothetical protein